MDIEDEEQLQQANNLASYKIFISKLKQEQAKARDEGSENGGALRAVLQIYQTKYLKEVEAAAAEGRPVQECGSFIAEVNRSNVYRTSAFMAKVHGSISAALAEVELALASESLAQLLLFCNRHATTPVSIEITTEQEETKNEGITKHFTETTQSEEELVALGISSSATGQDEKDVLSSIIGGDSGLTEALG